MPSPQSDLPSPRVISHPPTTTNSSSPQKSLFTRTLLYFWSFLTWLFSSSSLRIIQSSDFDPSTDLESSPFIPAAQSFVSHLEKTTKTSSAPSISIVRTFFTLYWCRLLCPLPCFLFELVLRSIQPYIIHQLLKQLQNNSGGNGGGNSYAIQIGLVLLFVGILMGIVHEAYYFSVRDLRCELMQVFPYVLYIKVLKLRSTGVRGTASGATGTGHCEGEEKEKKNQKTTNKHKPKGDWESQMMNLITTDVWRISVPVNFLYNTPMFVIRFLIAFGYVYAFMGWTGTLFALTVLGCVLVPINFIVLRKRTKMDKDRSDLTDERVGMIRICIENIRFIKAFFWEKIYGDRIEEVRSREVKNLTWGCFIWSIVECLWVTSRFFLSGAALIGFTVFQHETLTTPLCFSMMTVMGSISGPVFGFANSLNAFARAKTSLRRIQNFLSLPEVGCDDVDDSLTEEEEEEEEEGEVDDRNALKMRDCHFAWPKNARLEEDDGNSDQGEVSTDGHLEEPFLCGLNLRISEGQFVAVVGSVGSGKTCLANAILGEVRRCKGTFTKPSGPICFCAQEHWVRGATVRENVLFGEDFDDERYRAVLKACQLEQDLLSLEKGDQTKVGERGTRLSGGQKARLALARACYLSEKCSVFVFDDPIKDLDSHVCNRVFQGVFLQWLFGKTRILITHNTDVLGRVDYVYVMENGSIAEEGTFRELQARARGLSSDTVMNSPLSPFSPLPGSPSPASKQVASKEFVPQDAEKEEDPMKNLGSRFDCRLLRKYLTLFPKTFAVFLFLLIAQCVCEFYRDYFAAGWTSDADFGKHSTTFYLGIYLLLGVIVALLLVAAQVLFAALCIWVAEHFHNEMLRKVLATPVKFFDLATSGTILSRFSKDTSKVDNDLRFNFRELFFNASYVIMIYVFVIAYVPLFIFGAIIPAIIIYFVFKSYLRSSLSFARYSASLHSPVMTHFNETIKGLPTIRAFRKERLFVEEVEQTMDLALRLALLEGSLFRWLCIRGRILGCLLLFCFVCFASLSHLRGDVASLMVSKLVNMIFDLAWLMLMIPGIQKNFISLERIAEYCDLESEAYEGQSIAEFPTEGKVEFVNVCFRYREDAEEDVLKNISLQIDGGTKLGIVGRTGSGKSTLVKNLLRLYDPTSGKVLFDGVDITNLSLKCLRTSVSYIAQNPTLLPGSIRENLDASHTFSDAAMWASLRSVGLESKVRVLPKLLETEVGDEINFSAGEKQLLCFARAVLQKKKLLILDEATSSCDLQTDTKVQQIVKESFQHASIIAIAHRLETIVDYDQIVVLSKGEIVEYGEPARLIENPDSPFLEMIHQTGRKRARKLLSTIRLTSTLAEEEDVNVSVV